MENCLHRFVMVEGQGVEKVRALANELRGLPGCDDLKIDHVATVATLLAERFMPLTKLRGQNGVDGTFLTLGSDLESMARSWPDGSIEQLYALHNAATCYAQVNGNEQWRQLQLNREVIAKLGGRTVDTTPEGLLLRKVFAELYETGQDRNTTYYHHVVLCMVELADPDAPGRVEFLLRRAGGPELIDAAKRLLETSGRFKPAQVASLSQYLASLKD